MKGRSSFIDSFPEIIDLEEGPMNSTSMSQQTSLNNMLNPVESRLSNCTVSSAEAHCPDPSEHNFQGFRGWSSGESSSSINLQNNVNVCDGLNLEHGRSSSFSTRGGPVPMSEERCFEPSNAVFPGRGHTGNNLARSGGPSFLQGSSSNHTPHNMHNNGGQGTDAGIGPNVPYAGSSSGNSSVMMEEDNNNPGSGTGGWGSSCKRKALEGSSGQSYAGGSSSSFPQAESSCPWSGAARNNASGSLTLSTPLWNSPSASPLEQLNPRGPVSDPFHSSSQGESSIRNFGRRGQNSGHQQESLSLNLSSTGGNSRRFNIWSPHQSQRPVSFNDSPDSRSNSSRVANSSASLNRSHTLSRNMLAFPWNGAHNSRAGNFPVSGERDFVMQDEGNSRNIQRNETDHPMFVPVTETRNLAEDTANWNLAMSNMSSSGLLPSSTRNGASSSSHPFSTPTWTPHPNSSTHSQSQQRFWSLFPPVETESGGQASQFPTFSSSPSASVMSSGSSSHGHNHQQPRARSGFFMERQQQGSDVLGMPSSLRALATDIEGRHQLISEIRDVLNAMRRGENLRIEDYMLFDPFIYHGMAEMNDRHRDMRLDVDNMSYEELLALGERIGEVSTGLSEEAILKLMKRKKYMSMTMEPSPDQEPCCICQEEFIDGDDVGMLDCGHDFHTNCIKQWLVNKNICPICKTTGLET
ncbi:hypothetical protein ACFE04_022787 [Oxalis oulophora]